MFKQGFLTTINDLPCTPDNIVRTAGFIVGDVNIADSTVSIVWTEDGIYSHYYYEQHQPNVDELIHNIGSLNYVA